VSRDNPIISFAEFLRKPEESPAEPMARCSAIESSGGAAMPLDISQLPVEQVDITPESRIAMLVFLNKMPLVR